MNRERAKVLIGIELGAFESARRESATAKAWRALERAHIVSQPYLALHLSIHGAMLRYAVAKRDAREVFGQVVRLALAPLGALTGRIPIGNTGRANVSAFEPMPIPEDLLAKIKEAQQ